MQTWSDLLKISLNGNPSPTKRVEKSEVEWKALLSDEQFRITRLKGTERPHSSNVCNAFEPGTYGCVCCKTPLFDGGEKFQSGTGWPSFAQAIEKNAVAYSKDESFGMIRIEAICNTCDAHLGHVFPDGPAPSGLRYCINALALEKLELNEALAKVVLGGGCFWCTEAIFSEFRGVVSVKSGYSGGQVTRPSYKDVCSGATGHAEVIEISYKPSEISYADLVGMHLVSHNPTTLNAQGADRGTQYRSIVFYKNETELADAKMVIQEIQSMMEAKIVTELAPSAPFYEAEAVHQAYYANNTEASYCQAVISPKLSKLRANFKHLLKA